MLAAERRKQRKFFIISLVVNLFLVYFLRETLTPITIISFLICVVVAFFDLPTKTYWKFLVFLSCPIGNYWQFGWSLIPESSVNILIGVVGIKYLENKERRDLYIIFFCQLLIFFSGFLFLKDIDYFLYVLISFCSLVFGITRLEVVKVHPKEGLKAILVGLPLFLLLFFIFPRWQNQMISLNTNVFRPSNHQINLPDQLKFEDFSNLISNQKENFIAWTSEPLPPPLYWRSHVLTVTDGWNWTQDTLIGIQTLLNQELQKPIVEKASLLKHTLLFADTPKFYVGLDIPRKYKSSQGEIYPSPQYGMAPFPKNKMEKIYDVYSQIDTSEKTVQKFKLNERKSLLVSSLSEAEINILKTQFPNLPTELNSLLLYLENYFKLQKFTYNPSIGPQKSLSEFLQAKQGAFAHYASSVALILRWQQIPARLVVGYLGGIYNKLGRFYSVNSNRIHIWVEAWEDGRGWVRIDPTVWMSQGRLTKLDAFLLTEGEQISIFSPLKYLKKISFLEPFLMWSQKINADFYFWMEEYNRDQQGEWAKKWNWNLTEFYQRGAWLALILAIIFYLSLLKLQSWKKTKNLPWYEWIKINRELHRDFPEMKLWNFSQKLEHFKNKIKNKKERTKNDRKWLKKLEALSSFFDHNFS